MDKLLTFVYNKLKETGLEVYDKSPPARTPYPFLKYEVAIPYRHVNPLIAELTVDIWDNSTGSYNIEMLANTVDFTFENLSYQDEFIQVKAKRQFRSKLEEPEQELKRRQLKYQLRTFYKEQEE